MKKCLIVSLLSLSALSYASADWKVVAESKNCSETIKILGKEGEKYVMAVKGEEQQKLFAKDGSSFKTNSPKMTSFESKELKFNHPAVVDGNIPKIEIAHGANTERCKMELK